ncbi:hypothetical protein PV325_010411 [Microctonus aethiopoides]|uniref:Uncharacterized protein n=1 Tax=Microctonus aethiopoides TaxID=144406 RepID=A0AA39KXP4_9HYME|nr:hypothetical protein PV325_010411 [Microctonus aethiopoides]KAK0091853.1 hypothetical protein PV326_002613 [Microctonus aethiopoides]KAK0177461.1 hypothetical protein PV328_001512 [Microctonus aethiopoides]
MSNNQSNLLSHKEWRRFAKKHRRKRIRRAAAELRNAEEKLMRSKIEQSADYLNWLIEQEKLEADGEKKEEIEHAERERLWLETEEKAQKEWKEVQERKAKARQEQLRQEELIRKEFEKKQEELKRKREEWQRLKDEELKRQENIEREINEYIDDGAKTPEILRVITDSQPGKELCPFFSKTATCRYGDTCSRNHRRNALSKIIIIPGFYNHFSLEKNSAEYDTDIGLEFESSETRKHYKEFYNDIVPELESFGRIKTLKCCCNSEIHLRGNLYIEYYSEREAARAWRRLRGRWYGGRQLNCEFANFISWRNAVCGMNKCPKGRACNFLHTFRNPGDNYDIKSPMRWTKKTDRETSESSRNKMMIDDESTRSHSRDECRNWRWSESPQPETKYQVSDKDRNKHRKKSSRHDKRHSESRDRHSDSRNSRSKTRKKSSSSTPKQKKRRRSCDEESKNKFKKYHDTNKENGSDDMKNPTVHSELKREKSQSRKIEPKQQLQTDNQSQPAIETLEHSSSELSPATQVDNNWDTTDSDNDK